MKIVSPYTFGCTGTQAFRMCLQAGFHLKFARKYPLFALKLLESQSFSKLEVVKKDAVV